MAMTKDEFIKILKPIIEELIEEKCKEIIEDVCKDMIDKQCQKNVEAYVQQVITKLVFEKAAQSVMAATTAQLSPLAAMQQEIPIMVAQPVQEVKTKEQVYSNFEKFFPETKVIAESVRNQGKVEEKSPMEKAKFIPTKETKNMFDDIISSIPASEVAKHRVKD